MVEMLNKVIDELSGPFLKNRPVRKGDFHHYYLNIRKRSR